MRSSRKLQARFRVTPTSCQRGDRRKYNKNIYFIKHTEMEVLNGTNGGD
jgi:hypothetical protein